MLQSEYDVIVRHQRLKVLLIILTAIVVALVLYAVIKVGREYLDAPMDIKTGVTPKDADTPPKSFPEPTKTEFGTAFPTGFPSDIPVEKDVKFTQSYTLDYPQAQQLSIVFGSKKTMKENYALYSDYVKKEGWTILNTHEKHEFSFLYALKENMDMSVVITDRSVLPDKEIPSKIDSNQSETVFPELNFQVSITVLKRS